MSSHQVPSFVLLIWQPGRRLTEQLQNTGAPQRGKREKKKFKWSPGGYASTQRPPRIGSILRNLTLPHSNPRESWRDATQFNLGLLAGLVGPLLGQLLGEGGSSKKSLRCGFYWSPLQSGQGRAGYSRTESELQSIHLGHIPIRGWSQD